MSEIVADSGIEQMLPEAAETVVDLYLGDQMGELLGKSKEERDRIWGESVKKLPLFSKKILELRERLNVVAEVKIAYGNEILGGFIPREFFRGVGDSSAQEFLGDVLLSRVTGSKNRIDESLGMGAVSEMMRREMGIQGGRKSEQAKGVTLKKAVSSVLQGKLGIAYQPKQ